MRRKIRTTRAGNKRGYRERRGGRRLLLAKQALRGAAPERAPPWRAG